MKEKNLTFKCVVWDLDNTLWHGTLSEGDTLVLNESAVEFIKELDSRGILCSIASKNSFDDAIKQLEIFGIAHYFLYPQIGWGAKSASIRRIAEKINIGLDTFAFIDDQSFERAEVKFEVPQVACFPETNLQSLWSIARFSPKYITSESKHRREYYLADIKRKQYEDDTITPNKEFLASLNLKLEIHQAAVDDLRRAEELTMRTHQLNTTGYTYSYDELLKFVNSDQHILLVARLSDKFGDYGTIGLALLEKKGAVWNINLLLMSCRVMSRGVGAVMLNNIISGAYRNGVNLRAEHVHNGRNRAMYMTYKLSGFKEILRVNEDGVEKIIMENIVDQKICPQAYMQVNSSWG